MARGLNDVKLRGNLPRDPELRYTEGGTAVVNTQLGVNESYKNADDEWVDRVQWIDIVLWGRNAEVLDEYAGKGSLIYVEGSLQKREWEDERYVDDDGEPVVRRPTELRVRRLDLLPSGNGGDDDDEDTGRRKKKRRKKSKRGRKKSRKKSRDDDAQFEPDDDLPF